MLRFDTVESDLESKSYVWTRHLRAGHMFVLNMVESDLEGRSFICIDMVMSDLEDRSWLRIRHGQF